MQEKIDRMKWAPTEQIVTVIFESTDRRAIVIDFNNERLCVCALCCDLHVLNAAC